MSKDKIYIFDTTLRDGAQTEGVDFSIEDKNKIIELVNSNLNESVEVSKHVEDKKLQNTSVIGVKKFEMGKQIIENKEKGESEEKSNSL